jgi:hypothetical protein
MLTVLKVLVVVKEIAVRLNLVRCVKEALRYVGMVAIEEGG